MSKGRPGSPFHPFSEPYENRRFVGFGHLKDAIFPRDRSHIVELSSRKASWPDNLLFRETMKRTVEIPGIPWERCFGLQSAMRTIAGVEGDIAECGVRNGRSTLFMLAADEARRDYFLFDSWEGLSEPGPEDVVAGTGKASWKKGDIHADEGRTRANLSGHDNVSFMKGWIPDRFEEVADRRFALVHLDVDLYEPTMLSLEFFGPRLSDGGIFICDDYGSPRCPGARRACDEYAARTGMQLYEMISGQCILFNAGGNTRETDHG